MVEHTYNPLTADASRRSDPGYRTADLFKNLLRNYTCDAADGGSQPLRSFTWEYVPVDPCPTEEQGGLYSYKNGFLPAGNDIARLGGHMTEAQAQRVCEEEKECAGFTFVQGQQRGPDVVQTMIFKSVADDVTSNPDWHTFRKRSMGGCGPDSDATKPRIYKVDVMRESPPVFIVHDFVTSDECEKMVESTVPRMGRSVVGGGGTSQWRQSYSVNMYPDYDDPASAVTRLAHRKFAFAREVAGYANLQEGEGQEPINAVYYKDNGDQYRPHCDGECNGNKYWEGQRIATSLSYCLVADQGGYTYFSRSGLKVVPKARQMLFFGYLFDGASSVGDRMDNGQTEHTGCPLRVGHKWIATMWFRAGVTAERNWEYYSRKGAFGV